MGPMSVNQKSTLAFRSFVAFVELWVFLGDPLHESLYLFVFQKRFDGVEAPGQFGFGEDRMNFGVANSMQHNGRPFTAALELRYQMMFVDTRAGDQFSAAQWTVISHR